MTSRQPTKTTKPAAGAWISFGVWFLAPFAVLSASIALAAYLWSQDSPSGTILLSLLVGVVATAALAAKAMSTTGSFYRRIKASHKRRRSEWRMKDYRLHYQAKAYAWGVLAAGSTMAMIVVCFLEPGQHSSIPLAIVVALGWIVFIIAAVYWDRYAYCSHAVDRRRGEYDACKTLRWRLGLTFSIFCLVVGSVLLNIDIPSIAISEAIGDSFAWLWFYGIFATWLGPMLGMLFYPEDVKV